LSLLKRQDAVGKMEKLFWLNFSRILEF
jgi:hypothetical protein